MAKIKDMNKTLDHEFSRVAVLESVIEAQLINSILNEQNIREMLKGL